MPLRINELTSNVQVTGQEPRLLEDQIERIVQVVLERVREDQDHQARVQEETTIRNGVSEVEPY